MADKYDDEEWDRLMGGMRERLHKMSKKATQEERAAHLHSIRSGLCPHCLNNPASECDCREDD